MEPLPTVSLHPSGLKSCTSFSLGSEIVNRLMLDTRFSPEDGRKDFKIPLCRCGKVNLSQTLTKVQYYRLQLTNDVSDVPDVSIFISNKLGNVYYKRFGLDLKVYIMSTRTNQ